MKKMLISSLLLLSFFSLSAQKEVFFTTIDKDSVSISSMQGIFIGPAAFHSGFGVSFDVGYFNEKRMTNSTSLILGGNIYLGKYIKSILYSGYSNSNSFSRPIHEYGFGMGLTAFAEPRWYFTFKNRYEKGRNVKLNTGCFLGLPLELNTNTLFADSTKLKLNLFLSPIIGYRFAFSNHFFMETSAGLGISLFHLPEIQLNSYFRIKAAYTFK
ncbi:MAG: hypothetical protein GZ091_03885 [Paludibacter sp.]|nr:hypothetical protein [Paludibacter sp.]